ncbi:MAG: M23 family metallopeptidase, partial [Bacteroidota bacterium]
ESPEQLPRDPGVNYDTIQLRRSVEDSLLRDEIESLERFNLYETSGEGSSSDVNSFFFFTPLKGIVSAPFDARKGHHGVDVVAGENEAIKATLDGTVILATWTSETGHVIQVQHANNLVSIYKHNSVLLKKTNDKVKAGEAIAIIGESGENSTGPHLHFELWFNGQPIDPADYMVF